MNRDTSAGVCRNFQFAIFILQFAIALFISHSGNGANHGCRPRHGPRQIRPAGYDPHPRRRGDHGQRGAARNITALVATPLDCPEQQVKIISEDFSSEIGSVDYRPLAGGEVKQMVISIPRLASGATAKATVDFEVTTRPILPPEKTDDLVIPKRPPRPVRQYLGGSPFIETKHQKIRALAKEAWADLDESATDWERVEATLRLRARKSEVRRRPGQGGRRRAPRRPGRLPGPQHVVHRALPGEQDPGPHGLGRRPRVSRVLSRRRRRQGLLVPVRVGRHAGIRRDAARADDPAERATTSACPSGRPTGCGTPRTT